MGLRKKPREKGLLGFGTLARIWEPKKNFEHHFCAVLSRSNCFFSQLRDILEKRMDFSVLHHFPQPLGEVECLYFHPTYPHIIFSSVSNHIFLSDLRQLHPSSDRSSWKAQQKREKEGEGLGKWGGRGVLSHVTVAGKVVKLIHSGPYPLLVACTCSGFFHIFNTERMGLEYVGCISPPPPVPLASPPSKGSKIPLSTSSSSPVLRSPPSSSPTPSPSQPSLPIPTSRILISFSSSSNHPPLLFYTYTRKHVFMVDCNALAQEESEEGEGEGERATDEDRGDQREEGGRESGPQQQDQQQLDQQEQQQNQQNQQNQQQQQQQHPTGRIGKLGRLKTPAKLVFQTQGKIRILSLQTHPSLPQIAFFLSDGSLSLASFSRESVMIFANFQTSDFDDFGGWGGGGRGRGKGEFEFTCRAEFFLFSRFFFLHFILFYYFFSYS